MGGDKVIGAAPLKGIKVNSLKSVLLLRPPHVLDLLCPQTQTGTRVEPVLFSLLYCDTVGGWELSLETLLLYLDIVAPELNSHLFSLYNTSDKGFCCSNTKWTEIVPCLKCFTR